MADSRMGIPPTPLSDYPKTTQVEREARREVTIADLLVWAYRDQLVGEERGLAGTPGYVAGSSGGQLARIGTLGALVDGEAAPWVGEVDADPDARAVRRLVRALEPAHLVRVVESAAALARPPGDATAFARQRLGALKDGLDGRPVLGYDPGHRCGKEPSLCVLTLYPSIEQVEAHRALYGAWRQALLRLARQFRARPWLLRRWSVGETLPPELPPVPTALWSAYRAPFEALSRGRAERLWEQEQRRQERLRARRRAVRA